MVKYADGPTTEVEVRVDLPPAAVWPHLCDINLPGSFSTEFQRAEWIDEGPALGASFRGYNYHKVAGEWNVVCTVTAMETDNMLRTIEGIKAIAEEANA